MKKLLLTTLRNVLCLFLIAFSTSSLLAQKISGKITSINNEPLVGASVLVKGTGNGTVTNTEGVFTLDNVAKGSTLVVSYVGYLPQEISSDGDLNISLQESGALGEVVVTAENRSVSAQTVPIMMDLVSGKAIQRNGATDLLSLQNLAPGLNILQNTVFNQITVRGVGSHDGAAELSDQAVTIGIDGEYINRPVALNASMFDLDRVEVLKGPQGTLYGRNATAGAVNIIAKKPVLGKTEVDASASYGNYNTIKLNGAVNLPLGKIAALRVAGMLSKHDGYRESSGTGAYNGKFDNGNVWATRMGLSINPSKAFSIYVAGEYNKTDQQAPSQYGVDVSKADTTQKGQAPTKFSISLPKDFPIATPGFVKIKQEAIRSRIAYDFGGAKFTYSGGYRNVDMSGYQPLNGFIPETFSFDNNLDYQTQSHELRLNGETSKLIWQGGFFYGREDQNVARGLFLPSAKGAFGGKVPYLNFFRFDVASKTSALFAQATYKITEQLGLTAGIRNTSDKKERTGATLTRAPFGPPGTPAYFYPSSPGLTDNGMTATSGKGDWNKTTWMVNLDYKIDDSKMLFAKVSTGYKAGGFDNIGTYDAEDLRAIEVGSKNKFLDNKLRLNASIFNYLYKNQQVSVFENVSVGGRIKNAGKTNVTGIEIDGEAALTKADRLKFTINYLNAEFADFKLARNRVGVGVDSIDATGYHPIQSPKWTLIGGYDHDFTMGSGTLNVGIQTMFKSQFYTSPFNFEMDKQKSFTKTDLFITYTANGSKWDIGAYVQNLEDNRILTYAAFTGGNINIYNWIFGSPRLFGIQANYHFRGK